MHIRHDFLRHLRLSRGWTQQEVADGIEVDVRTYRKYESGEINNAATDLVRASQFETLRGLSALFGLSGPEELLGPAAPAARAAPPPGYVHREREERKALHRLRRPGSPVVLQAPEHFGAATLLGFLLRQAPLEGEGPAAVVRVHLGHLPAEDLLGLDRLLRRLGGLVLEQLGAPRGNAGASGPLEQAFQRPGSDKSKLTFLMEEQVLPTAPRLFLALEHTDRLLGTPCQHDFFALLRGWAEAGGEAPWDRLRLLLTVSTEPTLLESLDHSSFFALAAPIRLGELDREQLTALCAAHGQHPADAEVDRLMALIGGHPYLWHLALSEAAEQEVPLGELLGDPALLPAVFAPHLYHLRRFLEQDRGLYDAVCALLSAPGLRLPFSDYCRLHGKGLAVESAPGACRLRCRLYEDYFRTLCQGARAPAAGRAPP